MNLLKEGRAVDHELEVYRRLLRVELQFVCKDIRFVVRCIHEHLYDEALTVRWVLEYCGIRSNGFSQRFKAKMSEARFGPVTIRAYIEQLRLEAARQLLRKTDADLLYIALSVGYNHYETFERAFKRQVGPTPSDYRRQCRAKLRIVEPQSKSIGRRKAS